MKASRRSTWNSLSRLLLLILATAGPALAAGEGLNWNNDLQIHGFFSQGYVNTSDNNFYGDSEDGSFDFRDIGLNASLRLGPRWLVSAQLLSRTAGEMDDGNVNLDYGLVDFTAYSDERLRFGVIAGRFKNPLGLYNDTRDVPFTRPSVFLPQSIYWDKIRNIMLSNDGGQLYGELFHDRHSLSLRLGAGYLPVDENLEWAYLGNDWQGELKNDDPSIVGRVLYELDSGRLRLALSHITTTMVFHAAPGDPFDEGSVDVDYSIASFQYNAERWGLTAEYMREPLHWHGLGFPIRNDDNIADGYYLQGTYRPFEDWELLLRYDAAFLDQNDRDGTGQSAETGLPAHLFYSKTWSFGITWNIREYMMLRAQYDIVDGTAFLSNRENPNPFDTERNWDMLSLLFSVGF